MFTSHVNFGFENMLKRPDAAQILLDAMSKDKAHLARFVLDALDGKIVDARAEGARTPLISAVFLPDARSRSKFMDLLLRRGAGVDRRDAQGRTALSHACERGHLDAVEVLVRNNADPERADAWGNTSLMYAAAAGHVPVVEFLVRAFKRLGLQIDRQNKVGNSAAKVAQHLGHGGCLSALTGGSRTVHGVRAVAHTDSDGPRGLVSSGVLTPQARPAKPGGGGTDPRVSPGGPLGILLTPIAGDGGPDDRVHQKRRSLPSSSVLGPTSPELPSALALLRRFTFPEFRRSSAAVPRSETPPPDAGHPPLGGKPSVGSVSAVECEFDSRFKAAAGNAPF